MFVATMLIIGVGAWWASQGNANPQDGLVAGDVNLLVRADDPFKGPADAPVTLVEFSDFECPACATLQGPLEQVVEQNADKVKLVYRQFPLSSHKFANLAAQASLAANAQGKMWEYNKVMFQNQSALKKEDLLKYAEQVGMNMDEFRSDLDKGTYEDAVRQDIMDGNALRIQGTPTLFINGVQYTGGYGVEPLQQAIDQAFTQTQQ